MVSVVSLESANYFTPGIEFGRDNLENTDDLRKLQDEGADLRRNVRSSAMLDEVSENTL
jgi:hypothetical protein